MSAAWLPCPGKRSAVPAIHFISPHDRPFVAEVRQTREKCQTGKRWRSGQEAWRSSGLRRALRVFAAGLALQGIELRLGAHLTEDALQAGLVLVVDVRH